MDRRLTRKGVPLSRSRSLVDRPCLRQTRRKHLPSTFKLTEPNEDDPEVTATKWVGVLYGPAAKTGSVLCWINTLTMN